jgi:hypothetical protein
MPVWQQKEVPLNTANRERLVKIHDQGYLINGNLTTRNDITAEIREVKHSSILTKTERHQTKPVTKGKNKDSSLSVQFSSVQLCFKTDLYTQSRIK